MKFDKFKNFLIKPKNSDVKLLYKTTKLENGKYMLKIKGIELSEEQLKELGINVKTPGRDIVPRESKPPKWGQELIDKVDSFQTTPPKWGQELISRVEALENKDESKPPKWFQEWNEKEFQPLKNTPTMKKELAEMNKNND